MAHRATHRTMTAGGTRAARAVPAMLCVAALLFGMLWPATPMPPAWARAAATWPFPSAQSQQLPAQAWQAQPSYCTGGSAPAGHRPAPAGSERNGRFNCPICQLALGWSGTPQLPAQVFTPLWLPQRAAAFPAPVQRAHALPRTPHEPRAPPQAA
jgi:hypothetical protein